MYNFIVVLVLSLACSVSFAGTCDNGSCPTPVKNSVKSIVDFGERVVTAPFRVVRNTRTKIRSNRACRKQLKWVYSNCN